MRWFFRCTLAMGIALALSACGENGKDGKEKDGEQGPSRASAATSATTSAATASGGVPAEVAERMKGKGSVRIAGTIPWGAPHTARMTARIRLGPAGITASDTVVDVGEGERHREIRLGAGTYEERPPETLPPGKRWAKDAPADEADPEPSSLRIGDAGALDPADPDMLRVLLTRSVPGKTATVDGITTTEYGGTTELAQLVSVARGGARRTLAALVSAGLHSITWRIWLDGELLPHRFTETLTHAPTGSAPRGFAPATTTVVYSHWGSPDMIEAPPAGQVLDEAAEPLPPR